MLHEMRIQDRIRGLPLPEIADDLREAWGDVPAVPAVVESSDPDPVPPGALRSFLRWLGEEA